MSRIYGQNTPITATIQNLPLRKALDVMGQKLGLIFVLESQGIELRPVDALTRLGRRVTVQELRTLDVLMTTPMPEVTEIPDLPAKTSLPPPKLVPKISPALVIFSPSAPNRAAYSCAPARPKLLSISLAWQAASPAVSSAKS